MNCTPITVPHAKSTLCSVLSSYPLSRYSAEPKFIVKPRSCKAYEGDHVVIECEIIGDPTPRVTWLRDRLKVSQKLVNGEKNARLSWHAYFNSFDTIICLPFTKLEAYSRLAPLAQTSPFTTKNVRDKRWSFIYFITPALQGFGKYSAIKSRLYYRAFHQWWGSRDFNFFFFSQTCVKPIWATVYEWNFES